MRSGTRLLYEEPLVPGRTPNPSPLTTPRMAHFYAALLAQFCSALDNGLPAHDVSQEKRRKISAPAHLLEIIQGVEFKDGIKQVQIAA